MDNGGPAFPCTAIDCDVNRTPYLIPGMSLEDWFAGQAMAGMLANEDNFGKGCEDEPAFYAHHAYRMADAMVAEEKRQRDGVKGGG